MARHLAIGDIHGCYKALRTLCDYVGFKSDDVIIPLGDYVNRGSNTHAVIDWLMHLSKDFEVHPLRGNHEVMMLKARDDQLASKRWLRMGGDATLKSYAPIEGERGRMKDIPDHHWDWLENTLLPYFESETHFFVHANVYPDVPLDEQPDYMLYWEKFNYPPRHESGKIMVCGHTSQKSGWPIDHEHAICIDTWACGSGWLSCLHAELGKVWQANEAGDCRSFQLHELPLVE